MKPLTESQANRCENAKHPRCRCRCMGMYHGGGRTSGAGFTQLAIDDPHYLPPKNEQGELEVTAAQLVAPASENPPRL